jgi:STAS domain-containing protein
MGAQLDSWLDLRLAPAGTVVTVIQADHCVVWLCGEVDLAMEPDLASLAFNVPRLGDRLVIDTSHVTFSDATLLRFLAAVAGGLEVTIRHPTTLLLDLLAVAEMTELVKVEVAV